ncbi:bacillolysin precursor [bacterium BMS3Abin04]|nr:bacillolysin precursor [bacterium BMS3Abin04]
MKNKFIYIIGSIFILGFVQTFAQNNTKNNIRKISGWAKKMHAASNRNGDINKHELQSISDNLKKIIKTTELTKKTKKEYSLLEYLQNGDRELIKLNNAQKNNAQVWNINWNKFNKTPTAISNINSEKVFRKSNANISDSENAIEFISSNKKIFKLENPREELKLVEELKDELKIKHLVYKQMYKGIPVWGHEMVIHTNAKGEIYAFNAGYSETPKNLKLVVSQISPGNAVNIAENDLSKTTEIVQINRDFQKIFDYTKPIAEKYIWVDENQLSQLVWVVQIRPNIRDNWYYFVSAVSGDVLQRYNATAFEGPLTAGAIDLNGVNRTINVYQSSGVYYMIDASRNMWLQNQTNIISDPKGAILTLDAKNQDLNNSAQIVNVQSGSNSWSDATSVSAHYNGGITYEYYLNTHGRNAIDNKGSTIISIIHVTNQGQPMDNAYWNTKVMAYGDGNTDFLPLAGALDVTGHEMTHGVIDHTVNLEYKFQSGALNESLADVFGAMIDRDDWLLGEDIVKSSAFPSGAMRNMLDPHNGGTSINDAGWQPAHMDEFLNLSIDIDNGGVHINSGIPNRACALIGEAIGKDKTEKIYYRVMDARYLNNQSQFIDMRLAVVRSATDLYGQNSVEATAVKNAFDTVGIVDGTGTKPPDDLPPVEGDQWIAAVNAAGEDKSLYIIRPTIQTDDDIQLLSSTQVFTNTGNPITVTGDGSVILFIDDQNFIKVINPNGTGESFISASGDWNSISISPDGTQLAAISIFIDASIYIFDFQNSNNNKIIKLYNPTTQDGIKDSTVKFADALDWDLDSKVIIYDSFNQVPQASGGNIEFWTVNILDVANETIFPLFPPQEDGISIGNPSFSQTNSNFIVVDRFDVNNSSDEIWAIDLFGGNSNLIESNGPSVGYPKYSTNDDRLVFQKKDDQGVINLRQILLNNDKITPAGASQAYVSEEQLPYWYAVGNHPVSVEEDDSRTIPNNFKLLQNYPNPFNPSTVIEFSIQKATYTSLKVYDILGKEISTLVNEEKQPGNYKVNFDASNLSSGIYYYRLNAGNFTENRKMLLLK